MLIYVLKGLKKNHDNDNDATTTRIMIMTAAAAATTAAPSTLMLQLGVRITASNELMVGWLVGWLLVYGSLSPAFSLTSFYRALYLSCVFALPLNNIISTQKTLQFSCKIEGKRKRSTNYSSLARNCKKEKTVIDRTTPTILAKSIFSILSQNTH